MVYQYSTNPKKKSKTTKQQPYTSVTPTMGKGKASYSKLNKPLSGPKDWYNMTNQEKTKPSQSRIKKSKSKKDFNMPGVQPNYHWRQKPKGSISA